MVAVAIIPARGGSKGIPLKNLQRVGGSTILARAIEAARAAGIDHIVVSTDHAGIGAEAEAHGASVVWRPAELSSDQATSEAALLFTLDQLPETPDVTVFLQCTSPFMDADSIRDAVARVAGGSCDVVFSAALDHGFMWAKDAAGAAVPVGHEFGVRPRRQDRAPQFRETGAFYVLNTPGFRAAGHRFFGRVEIGVVAPEQAYEIDSPEDLALVRALASTATREPLDVDAVVTDFDGVHTDDAVTVDQHGVESVRVQRGDGLGVALLRASGVPFLILSKERNPVVSARADKLKVEVLQGVDDKASALAEWIADQGLDPARVAYVGNDLNDLPAMAVVGWPVAVADAKEQVKAAARLVLSASGGQGAVREVCDLVCAAR